MIELSVTPEEFKSLPLGRQYDIVCDAYFRDIRRLESVNVDDYAKLVDPSLTKVIIRELMMIERQYSQQVCSSSATHISDTLIVEGDTSPDRKPGKSLELPSRFENYILLQQLGRGASGVVYKAQDVDLQSFVAIKISHCRTLFNDKDFKGLLREARHASKLSHEGIVSVKRIGEWDSTPFIVSDFVDGLDLKRFIETQNETIDFKDVANILFQLANAMAHAHDRGIVHRDIKPSNIMIEPRSESEGKFRVRLLDFGISKTIGSMSWGTAEGAMIGTPGYLSPEQANGESKNTDERADIYSAGVILYELLCGQIPFHGSVREVLQQIRAGRVPPLKSINKSIPDSLVNICNRCMALDPDDRYTHASELAFDLQRYLDGDYVGEEPWTVKRTVRWVKKHRSAVLSFSLTSLVFVAISLALFQWSRAISHSWVPMTALAIELNKEVIDELRFDVQLGQSSELEVRDAVKQSMNNLSVLTPFLHKRFAEVKETDPNQAWRIQEVLSHIPGTSIPKEELENLVSIYKEQCQTQDRGMQITRKRVARLITLAAAGDASVLLKQLASAPPEDIAFWANALNQKEQFHFVRNSLDEPSTVYALDEQGERQASQQANLLLALYATQQFEPIWPYLEPSPDPRVRSYFWVRLVRCQLPCQPLVERLYRSSRASELYGLLVAIGLQGPNRVYPSAERTKFLAHIKKAFATHPNAGVHSACRWLLERWNEKQAIEEIERSFRPSEPGPDGTWFVDRCGMEFVVFRGPKVVTVKLANEQISSSAVNVTTDFAISLDVQQDRPGMAIQVLQQCAELDRVRGTDETEQVFRFTPEGNKTEASYHFDFSRHGIRPPRIFEWERATRCDTITEHFLYSPFSNELFSSLSDVPNTNGLVFRENSAELLASKYPKLHAIDPSDEVTSSLGTGLTSVSFREKSRLNASAALLRTASVLEQVTYLRPTFSVNSLAQ